MKRLLQIVFTILVCANAYSQSSVLVTGNWYKVGITESGIYKIDRGTLDALGVGSIADPRQIQLFGNGVKGILPQENSIERPIDLIENAIFVSGESDGSFDQNDHILFYGVGPHKEEWSEVAFDFQRNIYSDTAYYFLRIGTENGKRIESKQSLDQAASQVVDSFADHITYEEDVRNLIGSGRDWLGDIIPSGSQYQTSISIEGLSSPIVGTFSVAGQSPEVAEMEIMVDGGSVGSLELDDIRTGTGSNYSVKASEATGSFSLPQESEFNLSIRYSSSGANARGFIDRYYLTFERNLQSYSSDTDFRVTEGLGNVIQYEINNAEDAVIWNVTDPANYFEQAYSLSGGKAVFKSQSAQIEEFVAFQGNDFPSPFVFGNVPNQDLRSDVNYEGIIVSPSNFLTEATRLASFHRAHDGLSVKVVTPWQIYNEFSSGRQDVSAIRDYAKHVYDQGGNLKYILLFGDCSYEYKYRVENNTNFVPTYESRDSYDPIYSHSSDDFFTFFEEDEGAWIESTAGDHTMEIGVGRLPVKTLTEAKNTVDKIIYYSTSPNTLGKWKNEITYLADDGDGNTHSIHVEKLSELIDTTYAQYSIKKLLLDAFEQVSDGAKDTSPQTTKAFKTAIKEGTFVVNFMGHGNEKVWTEEEVFTNDDIEEMTNRNRLPIFVTATCEFGRYDDPKQVSGAERLLLNRSGGAIALLTTSRPVIASTNLPLNQAFHENVFKRVNESHQRLGDIIRITKNDGLAGPINRNFTLLGDPMLMPAFPKYNITLDDLELDTLKALDEISISGKVETGGVAQDNFNGMLSVVIYDTEQAFKTKGQESNPFTYTLRINAIFRGEAEVMNGEFSFSFIVPKNISYQLNRGKLSLYAFDKESNADASGSSREFVIGGTSSNIIPDNEPPAVSMFMNDESFRNGGVVGKNSLLFAKLSDESGITTASSGVVAGITLELNQEVINLNEFYTAAPNNFKEGTIVYPIQDLDPGRYSVKLKVWDTHNNSSTSNIDFVVSDKQELFIFNNVTYPNPVREGEETKFRFEHDREDEDLEIALLIYNGRGDVVKKSEYLFESSARMIEIPWKGVSDSGQRLNEGIYYYRLIIQSNFDGATKEITQKLVLIN